MRRKILTATTVALLVLGAVVPAAAAGDEDPRTGPPVTAMTQNVYIGGDIFRILQPAPECEGFPFPPGPELCSIIVQAGAVLDEVESTDYASRAVTLARTISLNRPQVVGLQEVTLLTTIPTDPFGNPVGPPATVDYLELLMDELNAFGPGYEVAAVVENADTPFLPTGTFVPGVGPVIENLASVLDRDVILVRSDIDFDPASVFGAAYQSAQLTVSVGGQPLEFTRSYVTVDVKLSGEPVTVVNTHLEPQYHTPAMIPANVIQTAQAIELVTILSGEAGPLLLLGDFNSDPMTDNELPGVPTPYEVITGAGFVDTWILRHGKVDPGYTCCQASDLTNQISELDERIDLIWFRSAAGSPALVWAKVFDQPRFKTDGGQWPADHAGMAARLLLPG